MCTCVDPLYSRALALYSWNLLQEEVFAIYMNKKQIESTKIQKWFLDLIFSNVLEIANLLIPST